MGSSVSSNFVSLIVVLIGMTVSSSVANHHFSPGNNNYHQTRYTQVYHHKNGYIRRRAVEKGDPILVFKEISYQLQFIWYLFSIYAENCDTFQNGVLSESFRTNTFAPKCNLFNDACSRTDKAVDSSDCFVRTVAIALKVTCCLGINISRPPPITQRTPTPIIPTTPTTTTTIPPIIACGIKSAVQPKIVGGANTTECEFPWVVGIRRNGEFICGGALINNQQVITAGHCANAQASYSVELSKWRNISFEDRYWQLVEVKNIVIHPTFDPITLLDDIAILTLSREVEYNVCLQPICLPPRNQSPQTTKCTVAGWGTLSLTGPQPEILQKVDLTVYSTSDCIARFNEKTNVVTPAVICADNDGLGGKDACKGDSGGPLMCIINGQYTVMGLVSSGRGCASAGQPGFYTNVPYFRDWINANLIV